MLQLNMYFIFKCWSISFTYLYLCLWDGGLNATPSFWGFQWIFPPFGQRKGWCFNSIILIFDWSKYGLSLFIVKNKVCWAWCCWLRGISACLQSISMKCKVCISFCAVILCRLVNSHADCTCWIFYLSLWKNS